MNDMFYAVSGLYGDYEAYTRALEKLGFQKLEDIEEKDIMSEEAVVSTLEGEDVLYVLGNIVGDGGGSMKLLQDMMSRDNVIAIVGENEYKLMRSFVALNEHMRDVGGAPSKAIMDRITGMLGDGLRPAVEEFVELDDDDREDIVDYLSEISEDAYLEAYVGGRSYVLVNAGIKGFDADKALDDYDTADFVTEEADMDGAYYEDRTLVCGAAHAAGDGHIVKNGRVVAIDCGCGRGGRLGIYCLNNEGELYV